MRTFRVDRIAECALLEDIFDPPADFDLHAYLASEPQAQPQVEARMRFDPEAAHVALGNRPYWESFDEQSDGSVVVCFRSPTLEWAASIALAYGPIVRVMEPPELRQMVGRWASDVAEKYEYFRN